MRLPDHLRRVLRLLPIALLALLTACSTTTIVYNNAPWLLRNKVDSYLDLTHAQQDAVALRLETLFDWHRTTELPVYGQMLDALTQSMMNGLDSAELEQFLAGAEAARFRLVQRLIPDLATLFADLDDEQIAHFDREVIDSWEEERELAEMSLRDRQEARAERWIDRFTEFYGRLEPAQRTWIKDTIASDPDFQPTRLRRNLERHRSFITLLRSRPGAPAIAERLHQSWDDLDDAGDPLAYQIARSASLEATKRMIVGADARMTREQRERAILRLREYRDDFISLATSD